MANITTELGNEYDVSPEALPSYSTAQLLEIHNTFADTSLKSWKQSKAKLIDRICDEGNLVAVTEEQAAKHDAKVAKKVAEKKTKSLGEMSGTKKNQPSKKPSGPRKMPKSYQMLQLLVNASEDGLGMSAEALADGLETSKGSIASYLSYFRKGAKGHDQISIKYTKELGFHLVTPDDIAAARAGIAARTPDVKEAA